jgi:hypothetical protein
MNMKNYEKWHPPATKYAVQLAKRNAPGTLLIIVECRENISRRE